MDENKKQLVEALEQSLNWNRARITFIVMFIFALFKVSTVNLVKVACALSGKAKKESNYRRIQRFFKNYFINYKHLAQLILLLLPQKSDFIITIDRTNWMFGKININILMAAIVYKGIAVPIVWMLLPKKGNSNTKERKKLMKRLFRFIGKENIKAIVADREFIGKQWLNWLNQNKVIYYIRIKENASVRINNLNKPIKCIFESLRIGEVLILKRSRIIYENKVYISGIKLKDELVIIISNRKDNNALHIYGLRWEIETLFAAFKSRGFNFESTHLTKRDRIEKMTALLTIAFLWAHLVGEWRCLIKPLRIKKHGYKEQSIFRHGLDYLQQCILNLDELFNTDIHRRYSRQNKFLITESRLFQRFGCLAMEL